MPTTTFASFREVTGLVRPPAAHGCPPVEIVPGLWTAHFHDIEDEPQLKKAAPAVTTIVNAATDKCHTQAGSYGADVKGVTIELLDDPDPLKKVDAMEEGAEKNAARAELYNSGVLHLAHNEAAGDARSHFGTVNAIIDETIAAGGATLVHCHASLSRSVAFILAYLMKSRKLGAAEAAALMKTKWSAVWPNNRFSVQLIEYEAELAAAAAR